MTKTRYSNNTTLVVVALLAAGVFAIPFYGQPAFALPLNPDPGQAAVGMVDDVDSLDCNQQTTSSFASRGGVSFRFKVPTTVSNVEDSNNPANAVNIHTSFWGANTKYYEVGMYYGDWTAFPGGGYDPDVVQFAWGVDGQLRKINLAVVEGHTVELSFVYLNSAGQWVVLYDDINDGLGLQSVNAGSANVNVKSDYAMWVEGNTLTPNANMATLGLVEIIKTQKATKIAGDGVSFSNWSDGFLSKDCMPSNQNYGVTYLNSPGKFKIGLNGQTKTPDGHQFW